MYGSFRALHLHLERCEALHHLVQAQTHRVQGLQLIAHARTESRAFQQQELSITQHRSERIVKPVTHLYHVSSECCVFVIRSRILLKTIDMHTDFGALEDFLSQEHHSVQPCIVARDYDHTRMIPAQAVHWLSHARNIQAWEGNAIQVREHRWYFFRIYISDNCKFKRRRGART